MTGKPQKVLVIGSGPIIIGQAAEFDYSGTQACKALREEGVTTILVNSNPATIMTDEGIADIVYIEPLTTPVLERIIAREHPDALLPTMGGQTGLNLAVELADAAILDHHNVRLLGTPLATIRNAEDRELFRDLMLEIGEPVPSSAIVTSIEQAREVAENLGLPLVARPAYTLGGTGGGMIRTREDLEGLVPRGLGASPIHQVLLERSVEGWKEIEYEVMRDAADTCITVCNMENLDPMGVHTGDSIVVAPSQTLTDKEYQLLRSAAFHIIRSLGIEGGCNVQFALPPHPVVEDALGLGPPEQPYYVIEVNPRVSRSSALASKATGYPIARVAAKIAIGKRLDQIPNAVTQKTVAAFEPALDYVVVKIPRWPFDKFSLADRSIGTQMKATGEVMAIDRCFEAALQKAIRSMEMGGKTLLWEDPSWSEIGEGSGDTSELPLHPNDLRVWAMMAALRRGMSPEDLSRRTRVDTWFTYKLLNLVAMERRLLREPLTKELLWQAKRLGFSDEQLATLGHEQELAERVRQLRKTWKIKPVYKMVDTCAAEFDAATPYFYSTYEQENEAAPLLDPKALVIGSGPIRIGQGIEFDYCSVHAAWALREGMVKSIMVNSNPETVSTDFDTSDRLYFEPLDEESIQDILENEAGNEDDSLGAPPSAVQFGGQTAIDLSQLLGRQNFPLLGSSAEAINIASDREQFEDFVTRLGIPQPPGAGVTSERAALEVAERIGYPVLVRPSYVLGGRAMEIVHTPEELIRYLTEAIAVGSGRPVLIDKYLEGKECEVDAVVDGETVLIPGIMEHIERAGVHSGDSIAMYPDMNLSEEEVETLVGYVTQLGLALRVRGLMNVQFVVMRENGHSQVYVLEVNPRASRTVPFISKVTGVPLVRLATGVMLGRSLKEQGFAGGLWKRQNLVGIKAPVFSMFKLGGVDTYLGPEMKSTGEVMGLDSTFKGALVKALMAAGMMLPSSGAILLSIADRDKPESQPLVQTLGQLGLGLYATEGTAMMLESMGLPSIMITKKLGEGHPNVLDVIQDGTVSAVVNTISGGSAPLRDGFQIRRAAAERRIPCFTSLDTVQASVEALLHGETYSVKRLAEYLRGHGPEE